MRIMEVLLRLARRCMKVIWICTFLTNCHSEQHNLRCCCLIGVFLRHRLWRLVAPSPNVMQRSGRRAYDKCNKP